MTLQQTVTIPADRRIHLDWTLPETANVGTATVILEFPTAETADAETRRRQREAVEKGWGIAKDFKFSSDDLLRNRREDLALENAKWERLRRQAAADDAANAGDL